MLRLNPNDVFIQSDQGRTDVLESAVDAVLLEVLDDGLNKLPPSRKKRKDMTESEVDSFISNADWNTQARYKIKVPKDTDLDTNRSPLTKSNVHVLPLSLEDNNTIVGAMSILDQSTFHLILSQVHLMFTQLDLTLSCSLVSTTFKVTGASWKGNCGAEKEKLMGLLMKSWRLKKSVQG